MRKLLCCERVNTVFSYKLNTYMSLFITVITITNAASTTDAAAAAAAYPSCFDIVGWAD